MPHITSRQIDLDPTDCESHPEAVARRVVAELQSASMDALIVYRGDRRYTESLAPVRLEAPAQDRPARLRTGATYLVTGGLGGMGLELAAYLAQAANANLLLTSRNRATASPGEVQMGSPDRLPLVATTGIDSSCISR